MVLNSAFVLSKVPAVHLPVLLLVRVGLVPQVVVHVVARVAVHLILRLQVNVLRVFVLRVFVLQLLVLLRDIELKGLVLANLMASIATLERITDITNINMKLWIIDLDGLVDRLVGQ